GNESLALGNERQSFGNECQGLAIRCQSFGNECRGLGTARQSLGTRRGWLGIGCGSLRTKARPIPDGGGRRPAEVQTLSSLICSSSCAAASPRVWGCLRRRSLMCLSSRGS